MYTFTYFISSYMQVCTVQINKTIHCKVKGIRICISSLKLRPFINIDHFMRKEHHKYNTIQLVLNTTKWI